jgi:hypothetical protein
MERNDVRRAEELLEGQPLHAPSRTTSSVTNGSVVDNPKPLEVYLGRKRPLDATEPN